ncbi:MAG: hypothetical protein NTV82_01640 [Candidatus Aminicenantes bacterium]|nr:hypothetical protein [Candidatus Aminicenantes bacterium]
MKQSRKRVRAIMASIVMAFVLIPLLEARIVLSGRISRSDGTGLENVRIVIDGYSTPDEILALKQLMISGDADGFYRAFRALDKAQMQMPATSALNAHFNVAVEQPSEKGIRILLITESRNVKAGQNIFLFLVAVLDLDKDYKGEGRIHYVARIKFPPQGGIDLDTYMTVPNEISNIHRVK